MAEQTNETNIFNQSFDDLIKNVGAKASNPTESSNVAAPATPAAEAPKAEVEEKKVEAAAETAANTPATDPATAPSTDSYRVPVDVFGDQEAVDPVDEKATEEPAKPAGTPVEASKATAPVTEPRASKEAEKPAEKPAEMPAAKPAETPAAKPAAKPATKAHASKSSRSRHSVKKTTEEVKDVITVTVPLNAKVAALLDSDEIQNIQDKAEADIDAAIKEAVKAAAEALINAL